MKKDKDALDYPILFQSNMFDYRKGSITINNGDEIFMEHRLKELFLILLKNRNDFVSRDELMAFVWRDIIVSEQSITKAISDLRKFFTKNEIENVKIITIRKLGYKLEIEEASNQDLIKIGSFKLALKILLYTAIMLIILIIIVRAINYDQ